MPDALQEAVDKLSLRANGVGVVAVDHPKTRNILRELSQAGIRLVTILSWDVPAAPRSAYVGIDNRMAGLDRRPVDGAVLVRAIRPRRDGCRLPVLWGHEEREMGFRSVLAEDFPNLLVHSAVEINDEPAASYSAAIAVLRAEPQLLGIYCVCAGRSGIVRAGSWRGEAIGEAGL